MVVPFGSFSDLLRAIEIRLGSFGTSSDSDHLGLFLFTGFCAGGKGGLEGVSAKHSPLRKTP